METIYQNIVGYINVWGYWAIFWGIALGNANIPIPSEIILGFAGYLVLTGQINFILAATAAMAGGLLGSVVSYLAGYYGGPAFIHKYGRYVWLAEKKLVFAQKWFERYGLVVTFWGRMIPVVRTFISLPAGFARVSFWKFVIYTILGSLPWTLALLYLGMMLGENWSRLESYGHIASLAVIGALASWVVVRYMQSRHAAKKR